VFSYTYDLNLDTGGPRRRAFVEVALQIGGLRTPYSTVFATNPPPPLPDLVKLDGTQGTFLELELAGGSSDADWDGYLVWVSQTAGFVPRIDNIQFKGKLSGVLTIPAVPGATFYVRYASFDKFSSDPEVLNVSGELTVNAGSIPGTILQQFHVAVERGVPASVGIYSGIVPPASWTETSLSGGPLVNVHSNVAFVAQFDGVLEVTHESWLCAENGGGTPTISEIYASCITYSIDSIEDPDNHLLLLTHNPGNKIDIRGRYEDYPFSGSAPSTPEAYIRRIVTGYINVVAGSTYYFSTWAGTYLFEAFTYTDVNAWFDVLVFRQVAEDF